MPLSTSAVGRGDKSSRCQLPTSNRSSDKLQSYRSDPVFMMMITSGSCRCLTFKKRSCRLARKDDREGKEDVRRTNLSIAESQV